MYNIFLTKSVSQTFQWMPHCSGMGNPPHFYLDNIGRINSSGWHNALLTPYHWNSSSSFNSEIGKFVCRNSDFLYINITEPWDAATSIALEGGSMMKASYAWVAGAVGDRLFVHWNNTLLTIVSDGVKYNISISTILGR